MSRAGQVSPPQTLLNQVKTQVLKLRPLWRRNVGSHWLRFGIKLLLQVLLPAGELSHVIDQQASQHSFRAGRGGWGWRSAWLPACATGPSGRQGICPPRLSWVISHRLCFHRAHGGWVAWAEAKEGAFCLEFCSRSDIAGLMIIDLSKSPFNTYQCLPHEVIQEGAGRGQKLTCFSASLWIWRPVRLI